MWKQSSILLLLLVGASWAFVPDDPEFAFYGSDGPVEVAKRFLDRIKRSVESRDVAVISGLFNPGFEFKGCKGDYDKAKVVGILSHLPVGTPFSMTLQSAVTLGTDHIRYSVSVSGFGPSPIIAEFILNIHDQQLQCGNVPACQRKTFVGILSGYQGFVGQESPMEVAKRFLDRIKRSVDSRDVAVISGLFNPGFEFKGCKGNYNKAKVVGILSHLPAGTPFSMTLHQSAVTLGTDQIKYSVSVSGFGPSPIIAEFILNIHDQQLHSGSIPACQHLMGFFRNFIASTPEEQVKAFLDRFKAAITSRDSAALLDLFQPDCVFIGCKATYDREQSVAMIMQIPAEAHLAYTFKSVQDLGDSIKTVVIAEGFKATIHVEFEFVLSKKDQKIEKASMACPKRRRLVADWIGEKGSVDYGFSREVRAPLGDADEMVHDFLERMTKATVDKNYDIISSLFEDGFVFKGCRGKYTKAQVTKILLKLKKGTPFTINLMEVNDQDTNVKYTVQIVGMGAMDMQAEFVLNKKTQKLVSGGIPLCQDSQLDSNSIVEQFLAIMQPAVDARDGTKLASLFDDEFKFNTCNGYEDKAAAIAKIMSAPSMFKILINFVSSRFLANGQIETVVDIISIMGRQRTMFLLDLTKNVLVAGQLYKCP
ncbi:hypothetical protein L3Y34_014218 [Caenorhabditis briggsae]|uniref:NTF2-like domain-containing protein n=1 Tax=Caenorhabditis briggsae TaxID=6238 RepID=A0AAE9IX74_CAEBR|nr:hypothetical protein L3Y34_014218 [Caenorhabditis briggsae]